MQRSEAEGDDLWHSASHLTPGDALASLNRDVSSDRDGSNGIDNLYQRDREKIDAGFEITRAFQNEISTFAVAKAKEAGRPCLPAMLKISSDILYMRGDINIRMSALL